MQNSIEIINPETAISIFHFRVGIKRTGDSKRLISSHNKISGDQVSNTKRNNYTQVRFPRFPTC